MKRHDWYPNFIIYVRCGACSTNRNDLNKKYYLDYFQMNEFIRLENNLDILLFHPDSYPSLQSNMIVGREFVESILPLMEFYYITNPYSIQELDELKSSIDASALNASNLSEDLKRSKGLEDVNVAINSLDQLDSDIATHERKFLSLRSLRTRENGLLDDDLPYFSISKFEREGNATYGERITNHFNKLSNGLLDVEVSISTIKDRSMRYDARAFTLHNSYRQQENFQSQIDKIDTQIYYTQIVIILTLLALAFTIRYNRQQIGIMNQQLDLSKKIFEKNEKQTNKYFAILSKIMRYIKRI